MIAAAHSHSVHGKAFSVARHPARPDHAGLVHLLQRPPRHHRAGRRRGARGGGRQEIAAAFGPGKAAIHQNHGLFTVGETVDEAVFWFLSMDRSCQAQLLAMAAGTPKLIDPEMAEYTAKQTGFPMAGWLSFQPLWQEICRTDPDLFD